MAKNAILATLNIPYKNKIEYEKNLYSLPEYYAVIPNIKNIYYLAIKNNKQIKLLDYYYDLVHDSIKLNYSGLKSGLYVFEIMKNNKNFTLLDIFISNDQRILHPDWCIRWLYFKDINIPKLKKFNMQQAIKYNISNCRGNSIMRNVIKTGPDYICKNLNAKNILLCGSARYNNMAVNLFAMNKNEELQIIRYCKKRYDSFYKTIRMPNFDKFTNVEYYTKFKVCSIEYLKNTKMIIELSANSLKMHDQIEMEIYTGYGNMFCGKLQISNISNLPNIKNEQNLKLKKLILKTQETILNKMEKNQNFLADSEQDILNILEDN